MLRAQGYQVSLEESYGKFSDERRHLPHDKIELVILTNTSLQPMQIRSTIPVIKTQNPDARIVVLSGYFPEEFIADLKHLGVDGFLKLPFQEDDIVEELARLLPQPTS